MIKLKSLIIFFIFITFHINCYAQISLEKAQVLRNSEGFTIQQRNTIWDLEDLASNQNINDIRSIVSYIETSSSPVTYVLDRSLVLAGINVSNENITGPWPLAPWQNHLFLFGEYPAAQERLLGAQGKEVPASQPMLSAISGREPIYSGPGNIGCYNQSPLRYGDIDNDNQSELVLFLNNNVVFFSPQSGQVTFSYHFWLNDELDADSLIYEADSTFMTRIRPSDPIYFAYSGFNVLVDDIYPARRSLTKLYVDDFVEEGRHDIILWRKLYESNARSVAEGGYLLIGNYYAHYVKQADGTYAPADTEQSQLQNLLATNNLTWPEGYPSQSECVGEEGR